MPECCLGDNYNVRVLAGGRDHFEMGLSLAFNGNYASYYAEYPKPFGLVFFWYISGEDWTSHMTLNTMNNDGLYEIYEPISATKPDHPLCVGECIDIAWEWLNNQPEENYPLHTMWNDVIYKKGFEITTGDLWGHVGNHNGTMCMIKPDWMWLGK